MSALQELSSTRQSQYSVSHSPNTRRRLSLSIRVSLGFVLAAIIPLLIMVMFSELQSRPALTAQANAAMESDAKARVQLIDTYFSERKLDTETLAQVLTVQQFLTNPNPAKQPVYVVQHSYEALAAGIFRDKQYTSWQLLDPQGNVRLYYPQNNVPQAHGANMVPPEYLTKIRAMKNGDAFISEVYYLPKTKKISVDIYSPIYMPDITNTKQAPIYVGFIRASLNLDYIVNIVASDLGNNGQGSYAFILDENGVRIADTSANRLFESVAPLSAEAQQLARRDARYGSTSAAVETLADQTLAQQIARGATQSSFQEQPAGQNETFQVVQLATSGIPWRYVVLSPVSTIDAVADQQQLAMIIVAASTALLAALIGLVFGRNITRPILTSVNYLLENSQALSSLAVKQHDAASEQTWVVDSSQVGLQSVYYYTDAINMAAQKLSELGSVLTKKGNDTGARQIKRALDLIVSTSRYIKKAAQFQHTSNEKLATALKVATQVTEQLVDGATSATDAAAQLEAVVIQLRQVIGG